MLKKIKNRLDIIKDFIEHLFFLNFHLKLKNADKIFTHLTPFEKRKLYRLTKNIKNGFALEIGSYLGSSSCFIASGLDIKSKLICIDTWSNDAMTEGKMSTKTKFIENTSNWENKIIMVQGLSSDVKHKITTITKSIDLLFIDGDHTYEGVKSDLENYIDLVKPGGCVVFHDYGWAQGVKKVVNEDFLPKTIYFNSSKNMAWGKIK